MAKLILLNKTNFGYKSNNKTIRNDMEEYFKEYFIPYIKNNTQKGDILIHCGNLFTTTNLNIVTQNIVIDIFDELSEHIPIIFLLSKKDLDPTNRNNKNINTFNIFRHNKKIKIVTEDFNLSNKILLRPWAKDNVLYGINDVEVIISNIDYSQYIELLNDNIIHLNGNEEDFNFSKNIINIGAPYHLNKNDINKEKGFVVFDTKTKKTFFIQNDFSKKYDKFIINSLEDLEKLDKNYLENNLVNLEINREVLNKNKTKLELFLHEHNFNNIIYFSQELREECSKDVDYRTLESILEGYIAEYEDEDLEKEYKNILDIYHKQKNQH